jgi:chloride channel 7
MIAKWVGDYFTESIYDDLIQLKGLPFLPSSPSKECDLFTVIDVMNTSVIVLHQVEKVDRILTVQQLEIKIEIQTAIYRF